MHKTCSLTRTSPETFSWSIFHKRVTRGLQGVPRVYGVFEGVTGDYKELQGIISGDRALQRVTCRDYRGYERLQGITKDYRKLVL